MVLISGHSWNDQSAILARKHLLSDEHLGLLRAQELVSQAVQDLGLFRQGVQYADSRVDLVINHHVFAVKGKVADLLGRMVELASCKDKSSLADVRCFFEHFVLVYTSNQLPVLTFI